ncbi:MAG: hypothetical protein HY360_05910 [Verrucomicrobia bacterium]|nr:hypothetical protein [Verrucomicrobiota bacterium]
MSEAEMVIFREASPNVEMLKAVPMKDASLKGKFWFCDVSGEQKVISTAEAAQMLGEWRRVRVITGPHDSLVAADHSADLCWEAPGDDDKDSSLP